MMFDTYSYSIASHIVPVLFNGDESGLSDAEGLQLEKFMQNLPNGQGHFEMPDNFYEENFCIDEVSGLMADCVTVKYQVKKENKA